jgi:hypothetical protein
MNTFQFPQWSDLGTVSFSVETEQLWGGMIAYIENCRYYFDGDVFDEVIKEEIDIDPNAEAPLLYPVKMNLVKMLCLSQADGAFGEYEELPFVYNTRQDEDTKAADSEAIDLMHKVLANSNASSMFWELELDRNVYGGGALKVDLAQSSPGHLILKRIPRFSFFPIWDPSDPDDLLEVYIITTLTKEQAKAKWKYDTTKQYIYRVEHWTKTTYRNTIDDHEVKNYTGSNQWGIVPFVYIPRFRFSTWWGSDLTNDIIGSQNELNMRVADIGEAINYNAHPTRWGKNLPRGFDEKNFPIGSNSMWDLGRTMSAQFDPEVGILEARHAVQPEVYQFVDFIYDWTRTSVFAPPISFGEDQGGGQRSGVTLEIRMWPLIKAINRSRAYLRAGMNRTLDIMARIYKQKNFGDVGPRTIESLEKRRITPVFNPVLPQDHTKIVDEVVKLLSTSPPSISLHTAQRELGRGLGEVDRIREMLGDEELKETMEPEPEPVALQPTKQPAKPKEKKVEPKKV